MKQQLARIWSDPRRPGFVLGFIAFNAGISLGYYLGRRSNPVEYNVTENLEMKILPEDLAMLKELKERQEARKRPSIVNEPPLPEYLSGPSRRVDGQDFVKKTLDTARTVVEKVADEIDDEDGALVRRSIFVETEDWSYELEVKKRTVDEPYILHRDEFFAEEKDYTQSTFTYYAGDDIMVDEEDKPVYNHLDITGPLKFGHGSSDPNVVYIRNDKRNAEYEIVHDPGLYSVEVLGLEIENNTRARDIRHAKQPLKFRQE